MKKNIIYLVISALLLNVSCNTDSTLEELSIDPNNPTTITPALLLTAAQVNILELYGFGWDSYANTFVQTFAGNHALGVSADRYNLTSTDFEGDFTSLYIGGFRDCIEIINKIGPEREAWQHVGVAKIIMATGLGTLTSVYGDIPYSEALGENINPAYDSQESIYTTILTLLEEGIADLSKTSLLNLGSEDIVHDGNLDMWKATAYTLLARYTNHYSKKGSYNPTQVLSYVDQAKAAGMTSNAANYQLTFEDGNISWINPWYSLYENNSIIISEKFMNMIDFSDPRRWSYFNSTAFGGALVGFNGKPNGDPTGSVSYSPVGPQGYYGKKESPQFIATYFELLYIEAEAALTIDPARAATALNAAIASQINLVADSGVPHAVEYVPSWDTAAAQAYMDGRVSGYITSNGSETAATVTISKIMTEKYISMFTMGVETWNDLRRHDFQYPGNGYLSLPNNAFLNTFIKRGLYPQTELNLNTSTPKGVTLTDDLWIFN